jgi:hypothetical protein
MRTIMRLGMLLLLALIPFSVSAEEKQSSVSKIHQLYLEDQRDRGVGPAKSLPWEQIEPRDLARRTRVHEMLASNQLKTGEDFHDAAFIYQHGQKPEDYLLAHLLAMVAVQKGDATSLWISAASLDRYLQKVGQPQVFGTQYNSQGDSPVTQEPYNHELLPDAFRAAFCVPGIEQQKKNVEIFNTGKYPEGIIPPGCTR